MIMCALLSSCAQTTKTNTGAPAPDQKPNLIDQELRSNSQQLLDEIRSLADLRRNSQESMIANTGNGRNKISAKFSGLDKNIGKFDCNCDLKVALQAIAVNLNWEMNRVYEVGRKPAMGVPVEVKLREQPLALALEQIDVQVGHFVDIRIDPNFKTILISYKTLSTSREAHK
ncbi:putative Lipoprotein [Vibrio nigripulchritudo SOn1]|uniref:Lipoprotein n=2 Tax=Vibrio nigripulchritudo TaxID=28173 RepID=A0AAV2VQ42_9VIBR|nr:putative Lipoprotein [Vibrio nigripulchritudo SOn1]